MIIIDYGTYLKDFYEINHFCPVHGKVEPIIVENQRICPICGLSVTSMIYYATPDTSDKIYTSTTFKGDIQL